MLELLSRSGGCRDPEEGADDDEDDGEETAEVGVTSFTNPDADWKVVTTSE
jgi:hypothetical protein